MADSGYSDGSVVVSTDLDTQGFEAGSERMRNAIDSSEDKFRELGDTFKGAMDQGVQAAQDAAPLIDKSLRDSVSSFQTSSEDIQGFIDKWAEAMPKKKFESSLSAISKMIDSVSGKFGEVEQAYSNAADGGAKEVAKFETKASSLETNLDRISEKIGEVYGASVKTKNGKLFSAKNSDELRLLIAKFDDLQKALGTMQTEIIKVKAEAEKAKAAEVAAMEKARAETEAAKESTRKLAEENKQAWQTVKQEIKAAETETKAFDSSSATLDKSITALENKLFALGPAAKKAMGGSQSAIDSFEFKVANTQRTIQYLRERLEALGSTQVTTTEYDELNSKLERARERLNGYLAEKQRLISSGTDKTSEEWQATEGAIERARERIQEYETSLASLRANGGAVINGSDTTAYEDLSNKLTMAENELANYESKVAKANNQTHILSATLKGVGKVGVTAFKLLGKTVSWLNGKFRSFNKSSNGSMAAVKKLTKVFTSFGSRIKSLLKRRLISSMISGAMEGIKNLAQVSPQVNSAMSALKTSLSQLKNSFGSAFAPILTAVTPILTTLIDLLSAAFTKVGMLISALTGATSFTKATKVQQNYAESLNDTSKAADKANKSVAGFDELNNTSSQESADTSSGTNPSDMFEEVPIDSKIANFAKNLKEMFLGGDFEGIGELLADKVNGIFKKINSAVDWNNVGPKVTAFVDGFTRTINSLVDKVDWALIGDTVAKGVNTVVNTVYLLATGIDWANLGKKLMEGLNGFIHGVDWGKLGKTIGTLFQSALSFLNSVVHNFDFAALAKGIGDAINNAFAAIDWAMLGDTLSTAIRNAFQFISTFVKTIDWAQIGTDIATFLNNIDWVGIFSDLAAMLSDLLKGALDLLIGFAENLDWSKLGTDIWNALVGIVKNIDWNGIISKAFHLLGAAIGGALQLVYNFFMQVWEALKSGWASVKDFFGEKIKEAGGNIWQGVLDGICEGLVSIGTWIYDNICKPFIDGFKAVFGIHSPSTVMAEMGGYLIQGLFNGISAAWGAIKSFFSNAWAGIKNICVGAWNGIKSACSAAWSKVTSTITNACTNVKNWVSDKFTAAKNAVSEKVTNIKNAVSEGFSHAWNTISSKVSDIKNNIAEGFSNAYSTISNKVTNIKNSISTGFSNAYSAISSKVSSIKSSISSGFSTAYTTISNKVSSIKSALSTGFSNAYTTVSNKVSEIGSSIKNTFTGLASSAWDWGKDICSSLVDGLESFASSVWDEACDIADGIADFLGFSEPEKGPLSNFHTFMPDMIDLMTKGIRDNKSTAINAVADLAQGIADEAQDASVLIPIDTDNKYTNFLETFSDKITDAFMDLISRLEAIAGNVTFATPAVAEGTVIPYNLKMADYEHGDREEKTVDLTPITSRIDRVVDKLDEVVDAIDNKETGITDEAVYNSVKQSARKETKSTGRNPFTG